MSQLIDEEETSNAVVKEKLNFVERLAMKKLIRKTKKSLDKYTTLKRLEIADRVKMEEELWSYRDTFDIENEDGTPLTREDLSKMSFEELIDSYKDLLREVSRLVSVKE